MMSVVAIVVGLILVIVAGIGIDAPDISEFEIERRKKSGEAFAVALAKQSQYHGDLISLQRLVLSLLLVVVAALSVAAWGWMWGIVIALFVALQYGVVARLPFIRAFADKQYNQIEPGIIKFIETYPFVAKMTRTITAQPHDTKLGSRDELLHIISESEHILSQDEKLLVEHALNFGEQHVGQHMTPRSVIDSIHRSELLNPLVLDQLHKTGHSRFPVVDKDIDHVVGVLHLRDLLVVDGTKKHTSKVETVMEQKVYYIREDQTLQHALAAFLRTRHHLFIVVNEYRETVGLLSLEDVIETLIGKKIVDEYDAHDDLRAVAARNPRANNHSQNSQNV